MLKTLVVNSGGFLLGIYVAQNYNVPNIATFSNFAMDWLKNQEETLRKSKPK